MARKPAERSFSVKVTEQFGDRKAVLSRCSTPLPNSTPSPRTPRTAFAPSTEPRMSTAAATSGANECLTPPGRSRRQISSAPNGRDEQDSRLATQYRDRERAAYSGKSMNDFMHGKLDISAPCRPPGRPARRAILSVRDNRGGQTDFRRRVSGRVRPGRTICDPGVPLICEQYGQGCRQCDTKWAPTLTY